MQELDADGEFKRGRPRVLSPSDVLLVKECKLDRDRLRKQLSELTDGKLAAKFECCKSSIARVKTGNEANYINLGGYPLVK